MVSNCELIIYGEGLERDTLSDLIDKYEIKERVFLPGHTESPLVALQQADCFVLPSVSHESCPAVLAQAMACGLPLITSDFGPLAELNQHGVTGLVFPAKNVHALAESINEIVSNHPMRENFSRAARRFALESLTEMEMVDATISLYLRCAGNSCF
jgi:glycosyltransferase involved in cell wall biosynthesis